MPKVKRMQRARYVLVPRYIRYKSNAMAVGWGDQCGEGY